jgi:hypothetical protein
MQLSFRSRSLVAAVAFALAAAWCPLSLAQDPTAVPEPVEADASSSDPSLIAGPSPDWGTSSDVVVLVAAKAFVPRNTTTVLDTYWDNGVTYVSSTLNYLYASVSPPLGALLTGVGFDGYDVDASLNIAWGLRVANADGSSASLAWYASSQSGGWFSSYGSISSHQVELGKYYFLVVDLKKTGQDMRIRGMRLYYKLQVSPAPATATFLDVPTGHLFFQYVEALAASGITAGCGGGNYCPDAPLTRGQMAVFLSKALGLHWTQ